MELERLTEDIFHIRFKYPTLLANTFLRFQEYYESPMFRGKIFTLEEYKEWYIANSPNGKKTGRFTYTEDWGRGGFNVSWDSLKPFFQGRFNPLTDDEKKFLCLLYKIVDQNSYIIGTSEDNNGKVMKHEFAHGMFHTVPEYREGVIKILQGLDCSIGNKINEYLLKSAGYHPNVLLDETHTFLLTCLPDFEKAGIDMNTVLSVHQQLNNLLSKYF